MPIAKGIRKNPKGIIQNTQGDHPEHPRGSFKTPKGIIQNPKGIMDGQTGFQFPSFKNAKVEKVEKDDFTKSRVACRESGGKRRLRPSANAAMLALLEKDDSQIGTLVRRETGNWKRGTPFPGLVLAAGKV